MTIKVVEVQMDGVAKNRNSREIAERLTEALEEYDEQGFIIRGVIPYGNTSYIIMQLDDSDDDS